MTECTGMLLRVDYPAGKSVYLQVVDQMKAEASWQPDLGSLMQQVIERAEAGRPVSSPALRCRNCFWSGLAGRV